MTPKEILIAARAKIEAPERWTKHALAKTETGDVIYTRSKRATCWCIEGAIRCVDNSGLYINGAMAAIGSIVDTNDIAGWNDAPNRTHAEVLAAFDRAIAAAGDE